MSEFAAFCAYNSEIITCQPEISLINLEFPSVVINDILKTSADAHIVTDREGRIQGANREAEELFGYGPGELDGEQIEILIPDQQRAHHRKLRAEYQASPRGRPMVSGLELYGRRRDGEVFRAEIALNPIETSEGLIVTSTIRRIDEADISEAYFRMLLESAPDAMLIIDEQGKIASFGSPLSCSWASWQYFCPCTSCSPPGGPKGRRSKNGSPSSNCAISC